MAYSTKAVANLILELAHRKGMPLSPMKLQKLVFFAHGWNLALEGEPLIDEQVEAWQYGPVIDSLYQEFKRFGNSPITCQATDFDLDDFIEVTPVLSASDKAKVEPLLDKILTTYGKFTGVQLSNMTHEPDTPWAGTWNAIGRNLRNAPIENSSIKAYFEGKRKKA